MSRKINVAIIGPGNIGTDLMVKALRSEKLNPVWMVGVIPDSAGLKRAAEQGLKTTAGGLDVFAPNITKDKVQIVFDATSAYAHAENARRVQEAGAVMVDLTPAAIGPFCIPVINQKELMSTRHENVNMVTCGGQATIPMVNAVSRVQKVDYAEIIATVASKSAGPGTRQNIDEFTLTTARAIERVGGAEKGKAIIIVNPAEPPIMMRDTVHCITAEAPDKDRIIASVAEMVADVQRYVPGYRLKNGPVFDENRVSIYLEITGRGDFLPEYAGNLDIMTSAALHTGELFAEALLRQQPANLNEARGVMI